ncbi:MAG: hypothetical protein QG597_2568, partial [Actinomycetota bacterium]|nr:hypothetical protein [Actinomycetota bacterium]
MSGDTFLDRSLTAAAVIVVPGIMGSELRENGKTIWGFKSLGWYFKHWQQGQFRLLQLTEQEGAGEYGRVIAPCLLSSPAFLPKFDVVNPYCNLVARLRANAVDPAAVTTFPYDWRLPVSHNGALLARVIESHAYNWSKHPALKRYLAEYPGSSMKVVVVAHSMGGLVTQHATADAHVDRIIALGTPWRGSVKTVGAMATGDLEGLPFSAAAVRDLVTSLPSMYDILPQWACIAPRDPAKDPTPVDGAFISSIGGDPDLWRHATADFQARAAPYDTQAEIVSIAGIKQPTPASVQTTACSTGLEVTTRAFMRDGTVFARDRKGGLVTVAATGDGTVPHFSASLHEHAHKSVQRLQHGQLAYAAEGLAVASHFVRHSDEPRFLAAPSDLGITVPQVAERGTPV